MSDAPSYAKPVGIGDVMEGGTVSEVVDSNDTHVRMLMHRSNQCQAKNGYCLIFASC